MPQLRRPPASVSEWKQQVKDDPSIHFDPKKGAEFRLKVSNTTFKSGSEISSTEYLHLEIIWHNYPRLEALGHLMKDDPEASYAGYVSADNMEKANSIFNAKRHWWQNYFNELNDREAVENTSAAIRTTPPTEQQRIEQRHDQLNPSMGPDYFRSALHYQLLARTITDKKTPTPDEIERTSTITKPGPGSSVATAPTTVNQPVSPSPRKFPHRSAQHRDFPPSLSTPKTRSFLPAKGGKHNKPAFDECYVNSALVEFLQSINSAVGREFRSLVWLGGRVGFKLMERTDGTEVTDTETEDEEDPTMKKLMETRVDGYLCQRSSELDKELNTNALAILEVKPFTLRAALSSIRRQEGAEMACWISEEADDSTTGLLQPSTSGNKRRWMVTQHRHEIYIIVAEYGAGYEAHIRPVRTIAKNSPRDLGTKAGKSSASSSTSKPSAQQDSSAGDAPATPKRRNPELLAGSPSYIRLVEKLEIEVSADSGLNDHTREAQLTRPSTGMSEWAGEDDGWVPDVKDFLIMHEFGPFLTMNALHMEVFSKRVIAFMLQLSQPQKRSSPEQTNSDSSSDQP